MELALRSMHTLMKVNNDAEEVYFIPGIQRRDVIYTGIFFFFKDNYDNIRLTIKNSQ